MKQIYIIGGGTFSHIRNHLSLSVPAFGETAKKLSEICKEYSEYNTNLILTKMADSTSKIITNDDISKFIDDILLKTDTKIIFFNVAMCDFNGQIGDISSSKYSERLETRNLVENNIVLTPSEKIISKIRKDRKDIFLVAFKTTCDNSENIQYYKGLNLLKENSCNLVLANDTVTRNNMIICPEEAKYCTTTDRNLVLNELVKMSISRSKLSFTRSIVIESDSIDWDSNEIPESLRKIINYCIENKAYKPFRNKTAGHFAVKVDEKTFLTSKRSTNFNNLDKIGLVKVESTDINHVIAYGSKPSVGGMSQRIIFNDHPEVDCIVHFHSYPKEQYFIDGGSVREQKYFECGSTECGINTSNGLKTMDDNIKAVYLDEHGPNIVFNRNINPDKVIDFIDKYFDLSTKTGGVLNVSPIN